MEQLYSIKEAARQLGGISPETLSQWLSKGRLPRVKVGRRTMIRVSDLEAFVDRCNQVPVDQTEEAR